MTYNEIQTLSRRISALEERIRVQETAPRLTNSSVGLGGIRSEDFDGTDTQNPGTQGWSIGSDETGGFAIFNTLVLRENLIGDQALANAVRVLTKSAKSTNFAIPGSFTDVVSGTLTVPDGFTECGIFAVGTCNAMRSRSGPPITFSPESIAMWIKIDGLIGEGFNYNPVAFGDVGNLTTSFAPTLTGLVDGQVITYSIQMMASPAQDPDPAQFALINLIAVFT